MKRKSNKKKLISGKIIIIFLYTVLFLLIILFLINLKIIQNPFSLLNKNVEQKEAKDFCAIIGGKLIHTIDNEGECQNVCVSECDSDKKTVENYEFQYRQNNCNKCFCNCKG